MRNKISIILIGSLVLICIILGTVNITTRLSHATTPDCSPKIIENSNATDFDSLNYMNSFDVTDFTNLKQNTIDIASLQYTNNIISIANSEFQISDNLLTKIHETINNYGRNNSFYIVSLEDGMSVGYNVDSKYETASSIKAPYALYIYEEIAKGNIDQNQEIIYESKHYNKGTGVVKNSDFGTPFTVKDLVYYSLTESDNVAHIMLHKTFGVKGYNQLLKNLGTKDLYLTSSNPWGFTSPRSAALVWQEIYNFSLREAEGITFLNILSGGKYNYFREVMPSIPSASKAGFANKDVVQTGIVFGDHPYIAIAVANKGGNIGAYTQVLKLINHMNDIMNEYDQFLKTK